MPELNARSDERTKGFDRAFSVVPMSDKLAACRTWTNPYFFAGALPLHADDPQQPFASCLAVVLPASAVQQLGQFSQHPAIALPDLAAQLFSLSQHAMPFAQQLISALQHSAPSAASLALSVASAIILLD